MDEFFKLYNAKSNNRGWNLQVYHSSITDWTIKVGYKSTHPKHGDTIITVQHCDVEYAFAKAQVMLKEWLLENEGGY